MLFGGDEWPSAAGAICGDVSIVLVLGFTGGMGGAVLNKDKVFESSASFRSTVAESAKVDASTGNGRGSGKMCVGLNVCGLD